jgi:hypothetical protein
VIESQDRSEEAVLAHFLHFLESDLLHHPERLRGMPRILHERLVAVTEGVEIRPDEPIEGAVAL